MVTQDRLKELLHYDPDTGIFTHIKARQGVRVGSITGYVNKSHGYSVIGVDCKTYQAHRLAWLYMHGHFPPDEIDHINRIRTDNRLCNLRLATKAENGQNQSMRSTNTSGHIGVYWDNVRQKWRAKITINQKRIHIGYFTGLSDAISARVEAKAQYHKFQPECVAKNAS